MHLIETDDLVHTYPDGSTALDGVNFEAHRNQIIAVIGANGAGKTTLFKHFNGLLTPTSGRVLIKGERLDKDNLLEIRKTVGLVFQNPDDQLFSPTVGEDVAFGPMNLGLDADVIAHRVHEALQLVGMGGAEKKAPHNLSYGEKKRVAIAGILAMEPQIMVMDEPTAGLDPQGVRAVIDLLQSLKAMGMSTIIATHDVDLVPLFSDRVYVLHRGTVLCTGTPQEIFEQEALIEKAGMRLPLIAELMQSARKHGIPVTPKLTIPEALDELTNAWSARRESP